MRRNSVLVLVLVLVSGLGPGLGPGQGQGHNVGLFFLSPAMADTPVYMGAKFCRTCHSSADKDRYHRWLESRHSKTFDVLKGAEKTDPRCLTCHTTGHDQPISEKSTKKDLRGVQCEACHGPGSEYKSMKVMKDPGLAREKGLWEVTREVCLKCHK